MSDGAPTGLVDRARLEITRGHWQEAFGLLTTADADGSLSPADLPLLGEVAYAAGDLDTTIETWERAHTAYVRAGDPVAAAGAAVRVAMHLLFDTALMAPVRGWLARAERLLEGEEPTPAHAWCAVVHAYERMLTGDASSARRFARTAVEIGSTCDPAAWAIGRVAEARLLILGGDVEEGLARLDEVGVATTSGDLDPLSTGVVFCELVCALQGLAQYDRAEEWTEAMERWCETNAIGSLHGRCRVHRAEILRLRGACTEAERQALAACDELRPYLRRELGWPLNELARIRLHTGDVAGAEDALLAAHRAGWDPQPGLALVQLARGDTAAAAASIREALDRPTSVPSKERPPNSELQRAPLLDAQVEIGIATGDLERARAAAAEIERVATRFGSKALVASAALARGRVQLAEADITGAEQSLAEAVRLWNEIGAPYEAARARLDLAAAHRAACRDDRAELESRAAHAILDGIRSEASASPEPATRGRVRSVFRREGDTWSVSYDGDATRVRDLKGMRYLARLLAHPDREFHALDLVGAESGSVTPVDRDAGELLDARAKEAYRRRLAEIDDDLAEAERSGDRDRAAQADAERDFLLRELSRAVGLSGRDRRASSASERARVAVTRAIRQAIARVTEHHPMLGDHLRRTIRTGTYCAYSADPRTEQWDV